MKRGENLKPLCADKARQTELAKRNKRRHVFNGVSIALKNSPNYKPRNP